MDKVTLSRAERLRCPCCGETFTLSDALPVVAPPSEPERPARQGGATLPVTLVFDGGSIGNPGRGYGSYRLTVRGKDEPPQRLQFGDNYTNNEAEYDTLLGALEAILRRAKDPRRVELEIRGDSQLVINQINGVWKVKEPRMQARKERVLQLLQQLGKWTATWHPRAKSVKALGH